MLPRVVINFQNGNLRQAAANADGVLGYVLSGAPVAGSFVLNKAYQLYSLIGLQSLGITAANNPLIYKTLTEFWNEAGNGSEVWLWAFSNTMLPSEILDQTQNNAKAFIQAANGRLKGILVSRVPDSTYVPTIENGMDSDVALAITNGQALAEWATTTLYAPIFVMLEAYAYSGDAVQLKDLTTMQNNRVGVLIGDTVSGSANAAVGILGGRIAKLSVQQNIARVASGALAATQLFIGDLPAEQVSVDALYTKGYLTFRTFTGHSGYFFVDDNLATSASDDYSHLTARRTIDKAYRILYNTLLYILLDEFPINADGTMRPLMARAWAKECETDIVNQMTVNNELSSVNGDNGVIVQFDETNNVITTGQVNVIAQARPFGYARLITCNLGFTAITAN